MKNHLAVGLLLAALSASVFAQSKPVIVVKPFTAVSGVAWPYDMKQMQSQLVAELTAKVGSRFEVTAESARDDQDALTLQGEILKWHPGNRATRMLVGMGSGRETAEIHYWLTDKNNKRLVEFKDTIRAEFWGNEYAHSVGELVHPFADKVSKRMQAAKLEQPGDRQATASAKKTD